MKSRSIVAFALSLLLLAPGGALLAASESAERLDGLEEVKSRRLSNLHKAPGADFSAYDAVVLDTTSVEFASYWLREQRKSGIYLKEEDVESVREGLQAQTDAFFAEYFADQGYRIAEEAGENTLRISPRLVNVNINVPDAGRNRYSTVKGNFGFVTLDIDFADAASEQLLAHARDEKTPRGPQMSQRTQSNNERAFRYLLEEWAEALSAELPLLVVTSG